MVQWRQSLRMTLRRLVTVLMVLAGVCLVALLVARVTATGQTEAKEQADIVRTLLRGLEYRESQPSQLFGEGIVDTYYGGCYWPSLEKISDWVRETPEEERRDRDRVMVRFHISHLHYCLEAQSIFWGGANSFFAADPRGDPWDVGKMHQFRGVTESGIYYQVSWSRGYPMARYRPAEGTDPLFSGKWPTRWLGLVKGGEPLSAAIRERIDNAVSYNCLKDEWAGLPCLRLTLYKHRADSDDFSRIRYWFAPEPGYDCALVRREYVHHSVDPAHADRRFVTEWRDFQEVPGLRSLFPRRWTHWSFVYSTKYPNPLDSVRDVHITTLSTEPPPEDDLWHTLFPPGVLLDQPFTSSSPEYKEKWREISVTGIRSQTHFWAEKPWEEVVPAFPEEWWKGIDAETIADLLAGAGVEKTP